MWLDMGHSAKKSKISSNPQSGGQLKPKMRKVQVTTVILVILGSLIGLVVMMSDSDFRKDTRREAETETKIARESLQRGVPLPPQTAKTTSTTPTPTPPPPIQTSESTIYPILQPGNENGSDYDEFEFLEVDDTFAVNWTGDFRECGNPVDGCPKSDEMNYFEFPDTCRCDRNCLKYGDCCLSILRNFTRIPKDAEYYSCVKLPSRNPLMPTYGIRMISKCPPSYRNKLNKYLCEDPGRLSSDSIKAAVDVPYINLKTGDIFRNVYCTRCHSVPTSVLHFDFQAPCNFRMQTQEEAKEFQKYALYELGEFRWVDSRNESRHCDLVLPHMHHDNITQLVKDVRFCNPSFVEECPIDVGFEGNRISYHLCRSYTQPVQYFTPPANPEEASPPLEFYKNPHCALCRHPMEHPKDPRFSCYRGRGRGHFSPGMRVIPQGMETDSVGLNILFDFSWSKDGPVGYFSKCNDNEILDFIREKCVPMICQKGYELINGECEKAPEENATIISDPIFNDTLTSPLNGNDTGVNSTNPQGQTTTNDSNFSSNAEPCLLIILQPGDYYTLENGSIAVNKSGSNSGVLMFAPEEYDRYNESSMSVCAKYVDETFSGYSPALSLVSNLLLAISVLSSLVHVVLYMILPKMRNLPGNNLLCLTLSLLISQFIFLTFIRTTNRVVCVAASIIMHYLFLAAFCWMNIMSFDIWRTFSSEFLVRRYSSNRTKTFVKYSLFAWTTPMVIVLMAICIDFWLPESAFLDPDAGPLLKKLKPLYGQNNLCWIGQRMSLFVFFAFPVALIILCNCILFTLTASTIWWQNREGNRVMNGSGGNIPSGVEGREKVQRQGSSPSHGSSSGSTKRSDTVRFKLYAKLALIMGLTWILGFLSGFTQWEWCWYLFVIFNGLQGTFIFLAFDFKPKIWHMVKERCYRGVFKPGSDGSSTESKRSGVKTLSTTLRSVSSRGSNASTGTANALIAFEIQNAK